jgi:hypothetical protein
MSKQPSFLRSSGRGRARGAAQAGVGPSRGPSTTGPPGSPGK